MQHAGIGATGWILWKANCYFRFCILVSVHYDGLQLMLLHSGKSFTFYSFYLRLQSVFRISLILIYSSAQFNCATIGRSSYIFLFLRWPRKMLESSTFLLSQWTKLHLVKHLLSQIYKRYLACKNYYWSFSSKAECKFHIRR